MNRNTYYRDFFSLMDDIFNESFTVLERAQAPRVNKLISSDSFPPTNIMVDPKTKTMTIEAALAGIKEDQINLSFDGESIKLVIDATSSDERQVQHYVQRGLKKIGKLTTQYALDPRFYDREKVSVNFENGLLTITIPPREEVAPKKIPLFGKLSIEDKKEVEE